MVERVATMPMRVKGCDLRAVSTARLKFLVAVVTATTRFLWIDADR
jgi:hypothetical protein